MGDNLWKIVRLVSGIAAVILLAYGIGVMLQWWPHKLGAAYWPSSIVVLLSGSFAQQQITKLNDPVRRSSS